MKRLIVCCDGTWNSPESDHPTNVLKLARAITPTGTDGVSQVVFYDWGVGTDGSLDTLGGGAFGRGLDKNILDAYRFLVHNYQEGDQIWFFGFSRGAYTARSCIGLLRNAWLLRKPHAHLIPDAYHIYRTRWGPDASNAVNFRTPYCHRVAVRFLGVWDTVGALGIPLDVFSSLNADRYDFHDTTLSSMVEHAYHALAIDERRKPYAPTLWKTAPERTRTEQCWFAGVHSDIGGGYPEDGLASVTLRWMTGKARAAGLGVDRQYLETLYSQDSREIVHNSYRGWMRALGSHRREIGVSHSDETLHSSAEQRYLNNAGYRPPNLKRYLKRNEQIQLPMEE